MALESERARPARLLTPPFAVALDAAYRWAAQLAGGRDVLVVGRESDRAAALLADAGPRSITEVDADRMEADAGAGGDRPDARGDRDAGLELEDDGFDLVTCFGPLEHSPEPDPLISALRRVLRQDGTLLASLPLSNEGAEEPPIELEEDHPGVVTRRLIEPATRTAERWQGLLGESFRNVRLVQRQVCIAVIIDGSPVESDARRLGSAWWLPGGPSHDRVAIALASDAELPAAESTASLAGLSEIHALRQQLADWEERARRAEAEGSAKHWEVVAARESQRRLRKRLHTLEHRPLRILSRAIRGKPARLGPGPPIRASEREPDDWD